MTTERLAEIEARFQAARPKVDRGGEELKMTVQPHLPNSSRMSIFYADGDGAATVHGNLGLDVDGDALARFWANAWVDVRDLLEEIERLRK